MNKPKVTKRVKISIVLLSIINIIVLCLWFYLKAVPLIPKIRGAKESIINDKLDKTYTNLDTLIVDIDNISKTYKLSYKIVDEKHNIIIDYNKNKFDMIFLSEIIKVGKNNYLINFYPNSHISVSRVIIELLFFELIIVTLIYLLTFVFVKNKLINPIDKIVNDIKNYKKGKKPVKEPLNDEFDIIQNEFIDLTNELDEEKKEQNRIISSISHDLKTPLTSIIGYSNLISDKGTTKKEIKIYNEKILSKAKHIQNILNTFDDYLINKNDVKIKMEAVKIKDLVNDLNYDYKIELQNKNINFIVSSNVNSKYIKVDYLRIKRVFSNIISNSVRYLKDGGKIHIKISKEDENIKFLISDNGPGVKENMIDKIFNPLYTTDNSRKISGLGLSICKEFIESHNGSIKAYNNKGLTIEILLPILK